MKTNLCLLFALYCLSAFGQAPFTNIYLPGTWPSTTWWTNSPYPSSVVSSNAWQAVNENFLRTSNALINLTTLSNGLVLPKSLGGRAIDATAQTNIWEDISFQPTGINPVGVAAAATLVGDAGPAANMLALDFAQSKVALVNPQMQHSWVAGTKVYAHGHFLPKTTGSGAIVWKVTALSSDIGATMITNSVTQFTNTIDGSTNQHRHLLWNMPPDGITLTNGAGPSTMQLLRIERMAAAQGDTYSGAISMIGFDVHYRWGGSPTPYNP